MKTTIKYLFFLLFGIFLLNCTGKSNKSQPTQNNEPKALKNNLFSKEITGDKTEKPMNEIFFESVLLKEIKSSLGFDFYIQSNHFFQFATANPPELELNGNVRFLGIKKYATRNATKDTWIRNENPSQDSKISYDNRGVVTLISSNKFSKQNYKVNYLNESSKKFESILLTLQGDRGIIAETRLDFKYKENGILKSMYVYQKFSNDTDFLLKEQKDFLYYEHGLAVGSAFYSYIESDSSKVHQVYDLTQGLLYTNSIDENGNQYFISEQKAGNYNDTAAIYDKDNRTIYANKTYNFPKYNIGTDMSTIYKTIYTKFDYNGNWVKAEEYSYSKGDKAETNFPFNIIEREISYY